MGKRSDPNSVIDSRARVIGVQGLRVVDASSFPFLPPGHPSATICKFIPSQPRPSCFLSDRRRNFNPEIVKQMPWRKKLPLTF